MDDELKAIIDDILADEDNTGCDGDLTVTSKSACDRLREYRDHYEMGRLTFSEPVKKGKKNKKLPKPPKVEPEEKGDREVEE